MTDQSECVAVIGMAGRFPMAAGVAEFWDNLRQGRECIRFFSEEELRQAGVPDETLAHPAYVRANGVVDGIEQFDADFFGFTPREAEILDPQQRIFLECAAEALEDAGCVAERHPGMIGVFAGTSMSTYAFQLYGNAQLAGRATGFQILIGNDKDHLATRVAYKLNLKGPAITVGTACSTSLVAVGLACQSLIEYQSDVALAGGVTLGVPMLRGYLYEEGGIASPDGHCRSFDAAAMGTVGANGAGCVVLKRLADALADGDPICAVIRGWGLNNDGADKVGYTAPSVAGQAHAIATALAMAGVAPDTITMMEAHGTATPLGDPIEFAALCQAWRHSTQRRYCALGSVKSNTGHMDSAAGVAGLIKCVLALQHRQIPPSLHFERPNPKLDMENSPFFVNTALRDWQPECGVRRAAVSSFGIGGTNAHVILEEAPAVEPGSASRAAQLLLLSARTPSALEAAAARLSAHLDAHPGLALPDVAHTLQLGRSAMKCRRAIVVPPGADNAAALLRQGAPRRAATGGRDGKFEGVAFLFPGQGAQHPAMGASLYRAEPVYRQIVDHCAGLLREPLGLDLRPLMHGADQGEALRQTQVTQAAVFVASYALARLWMHWGVKPAVLAGHSVGEYTAACLAGVLSLEDALLLIARRGRILAGMPAGAMLAVAQPEAALRARFAGAVEIAAVNGPALCVLSGSVAAIEEVRRQLENEGATVQALHTSHAFHSQLVDGAVAPMIEAMDQVRLHAPTIPYLSNLSGHWIGPHEAQNPEYWGRHLRGTVRFADCLGHLLRDTGCALLEVGPGQTLATFARQHEAYAPGRLIVSSCRHARDTADDDSTVLQALGSLWTAGAAVDWPAFYGAERRRRVPLPTYPFERQRYWIESSAAAPALPAATAVQQPLEDWLYQPRWVRTAPAAPLPADYADGWAIAGGAHQQVAALAETLADLGQTVERIASAADPGALASTVRTVIALDGIADQVPSAELYYRALALLHGLSRRGTPTTVLFVTRWTFAVAPREREIEPERAGIIGLAIAAAQEYPQLSCRLIDLDAAALSLLGSAHAAALLAEALPQAAPWIAYRGAQRWALTFEPAPLAPVQPALAPALEGCYLITGGLGKIGLLIAEFLARRGAATVVLTGRSAMPQRAQWEDSSDPRLGRLRMIETMGTKVVLCSADGGVAADVARLVAEARAQGGKIHGVFHAAGLTAAAYFPGFADIGRDVSEAHFAAKPRAAQLLAEALRDDPPGFVCLMSSISAVLGGIGFGPYAAANAMLDALAAQQSGATRWISINWDGWTFENQGAAANEALVGAEDGIEVLERALAAPEIRQLIVSVAPLGPRLQRWLQPPAASAAPAPAPSASHERPEMSAGFIAPAPGRQMLIADLWRDLMGISPIGADDNFFELGGHSLLAIQVVSRLREALQRDLPVRILFDHPTVAALAAALDALDEQPDAELARLLDRIEAMPDAEVSSLLDERGPA
ncbi:type I polyketide synthase [Massilia sp. YIM B04103]|uniref:type I polyketide synthase n=1 Tax=Massilia sp. YIM B04103 TaxID=2963106 RepID=UPI00210CB7B5|nr:type I polyketide synthase [Massilia sp. YIM B04103]